MNDEVKTLLLRQRDPWPKWGQGLDADGRKTTEQHLYLFEETIAGGFGNSVPLCRFVNGAAWVGTLVTEHDVQNAAFYCGSCISGATVAMIEDATAE